MIINYTLSIFLRKFVESLKKLQFLDISNTVKLYDIDYNGWESLTLIVLNLKSDVLIRKVQVRFFLVARIC